MPLYPYRCTQCGHRFEKIQHFNDEPEKVCPECGGALERILTAPGLSFKGAGWYVNDYAAKGGSSGSDSKAETSKSESKPDANSEKKSETKSGTKSEPKAAATGSSNAAPAPSTPAAASKPTTGS